MIFVVKSWCRNEMCCDFFNEFDLMKLKMNESFVSIGWALVGTLACACTTSYFTITFILHAIKNNLENEEEHPYMHTYINTT